MFRMSIVIIYTVYVSNIYNWARTSKGWPWQQCILFFRWGRGFVLDEDGARERNDEVNYNNYDK